MADKPVSTGRKVFAVVVFALLAGVCILLGLAEDATYPYGIAALFLWLALFAVVPRGRNRGLDNLVELIGGAVLFVAGVLVLLERDEVREMAEAGRDRSFVIIWVVAPALVVGGLFYLLRGLARGLRSRGPD